MKGLQIAVILLVLSISTLEALKCYSCVTDKNGVCSHDVETCEDSSDMCVSETKNTGNDVFKGCKTAGEIEDLQGYTVVTCSTDLCN